MSKLISVSAAGALAFGAVAAHASIALPTSGASDAILFAEVVNATGSAVASYAGDTGISINSIIAGLSGSTTVLGTDNNLSKLFAADAAGDTIQFAVLGGQYTSISGAPGAMQFLSTTANNSTTGLAGATTGTLTKFALINTDIGTINSNSGGASSVEGSIPANAGVWDVENSGSLAYWDGGSISNGNTQGTSANLYYVTGKGTAPPTHVGYTLEATATLSASGLTLTGGTTPPPIPLPPAVWLLGSGLLGLAGVARRKTKA